MDAAAGGNIPALDGQLRYTQVAAGWFHILLLRSDVVVFRERFLRLVQLACTIHDFCNLDVALCEWFINGSEFLVFQTAFGPVPWPFDISNSLSWISYSVTSSHCKVVALCSPSSSTSLLPWLRCAVHFAVCFLD